jgi:hypothetical protein
MSTLPQSAQGGDQLILAQRTHELSAYKGFAKQSSNIREKGD